ncbi:MAG: hypothetical protein RJA07_472 [Bacteroidota bacterium]|jgi:hypothetical protein
MTIDLALHYIPKRMQELGFNEHYHLRMRHLVLQAQAEANISSYNQLVLLVDEVNDIRVESDTGVYDLTETNVNELTYEHQGVVKIQNQSPLINRIRFIQVIPK